MNRYLLNSAVLTGFGEWSYRSISTQEAQDFVSLGYICAIRYPPTAEKLSELLGAVIEHNDLVVQMEVGDEALVYRPSRRLSKGPNLTDVEFAELDWELGLLKRNR